MDKALACLWCKASDLSCLNVAKKKYFQCRHCEYIFLDPQLRLSASAEKARYELHQNDVHDQGYQAFVMPLKTAIKNQFSSNALGLDYGSGKNSALCYLLEKEQYTIKKYDPFFNQDKSVLTAETYDFISVCEVAEHFFQPATEFQKLNSYLKPGGVIFVMTSLLTDAVDFTTWSYRRDETHVGFFAEKTFSTCYLAEVKSANLVVLKVPPPPQS